MSGINVAEVLNSSLSPDPTVRQGAENQLEQLQQSSYPNYLISLSQALSTAETPAHIRSAAGIAIKNALSAKESSRQDAYSARWKDQLDEATRHRVKEAALSTLADSATQPRLQAGQIVAAIAAIELPAQQWMNLVPQLLEFVSQQDNTGLRQGALQAIGLVCEQIVSLWKAVL